MASRKKISETEDNEFPIVLKKLPELPTPSADCLVEGLVGLSPLLSTDSVDTFSPVADGASTDTGTGATGCKEFRLLTTWSNRWEKMVKDDG